MNVQQTLDGRTLDPKKTRKIELNLHSFINVRVSDSPRELDVGLLEKTKS